MNNSTNPQPPHSARYFVIRIAAILDASWSDWFAGMRITPAGEGQPQTLLTGYIRDQAELFGVLYKVNSLNLTLLSVQSHDSEKKEQWK